MRQVCCPNVQENPPKAGQWVYIDIPPKTSRYTLFCEVADRPHFKNRTVRRYKPVSQSAFNAPQGRTVRSYVFHTTRDQQRLWNNFEVSLRTVRASGADRPQFTFQP